MENSFESIVMDIIKLRPTDVALLYKQYGIYKPVNYENTISACILFKEPFIMELYHIGHNHDSQQNFAGGVIKKIFAKKTSSNLKNDVKFSPSTKSDDSANDVLPNTKQNQQKEKGKGWSNFVNGFKQTIGLAKETVVIANDVKGVFKGGGNAAEDTPADNTPSKKIAGVDSKLVIGLVVAVVIVLIVAIVKMKK